MVIYSTAPNMETVSKEKYLLHTKFETARTILAFLCREKLNEVAELFIKTCPYLEFERNAIKEGYAPFNFAYQPISEILHDYSQMGRKLSQLVQQYGCNLSFQRSMTDLEKIEYLLEFQSSRTTFVQDGGVKSGLDATGAQPATTRQTFTTSQDMFSQLPDGVQTYKENETVSYMIIPDYDGSGTGVNEYTQGGTVSTVNNFSMSTANDAPVYGEAPAAMPTEASNEPVPTHYVLYDDNGNEQQIMIELITQGNNGTSAPEAATQANQTTPSNAGFQASPCPTSSYSVPSTQNEHVGSVGEPLYVHTISNTADANQYHLPVEENNQLMLVTSQVPQEQVHIETQNTGEEVAMGSVAGDFDAQSACHGTASQQETAARLDAKKSYLDPPQSTVTVTTTINQQKVVTRLQDIRRSLCMARPVLTDTVSSTTPQKAPQIPPVPKGQSRNTASKALPSRTIKKGKAVKPDDTVENQPPMNGTVVATEAGATIDPTVSAMEEWKRIRSINRSNFDNIVRQEISRDIDLQDQEKSIQMRERKKAALRLAKLRKKMVKTEPSEPQAEPACESSAPADQPVEQNSGKPATRKRKQRALAVTAKRELKAPAEQLVKQNSAKPVARKRRQRALSVTAKRTKRSSVETVANPNDSLEKNAALLEAALYTPMKSDNDQQQQQQQQMPVSLTLTPAQQMPTEMVASGLGSQIKALPLPETYQAVQPAQVPQSAAPDTSVTKPPSAEKKNDNITSAQHTQPTPSIIAMDTASPLKTSPPAAQAETEESPTETGVAEAQDETAQAVASITALAPSTPFKVKISLPIARKHLSNRKRTASSDTSSSGSSSDSECNSSCSSSSSSTTMEEDEDIRRMVQNTKRYRAGKRVQQPAGRSGPAVAIVTLNSPRKQNVIRINGSKVGQANKPQTVAPEPGDSDAVTATVSRIKVVTNRQQSTAKQVQPKLQKQQPKQAKQRPEPKGHAESTSPLPAPQPLSVQSAQSKKGKSPTASEKAAVTTPTRTKTPRKQQLIPTKLDSDDTFIPPTSPRVPQRPTQKSPKPQVRNRYATSRLPAAALSEKLKLAKVQRVQRVDAQPLEATGLEPKEQTVDGNQQENAPVNVVPVSTATTTTTTTTASSPKVLRPDATVCQEAIYAVLAQIHGK